jgi:N-acetylated-alpha-linked acidic dipeptidase
MVTPGSWKDEQLEQDILGQITIDAAWTAVEKLGSLVRTSGSEEEAEAARHLTNQLEAFGVNFDVHYPTCLISMPGKATLRTNRPGGREYTIKTTAMSPSTGGKDVTAELVYVPGEQPQDMRSIFGSGDQKQIDEADLTGKVIITEGRGMSARNLDLGKSGAVAALFVNPGERIHEGITTISWGSPDLDSLGRTPPVPILTINRSEGEELIERAKAGPVKVTFSSEVEIGWKPIPVIVAEIKGSEAPEEFVLLHGHLDGWHLGVGDNATGCATMLEIARVFQANRDKLKRSVRIAWWSGHSHGRYAGSTWYTDAYALDLMENCVSHVNCDSPGCRWATVYENVMWMPEAETLAKTVIKDVTGQDSTGARPLRAGDCAFNNIGIPLYFMLSSTMPDDLRAEKGYYPVGGCGGNIAWHTEDDTMEIADKDNLLRDIKVYAISVLRTLNAPFHPFDYRATVSDLRSHVERYQSAAGKNVDFSPAIAELDALDNSLERFYATVASDVSGYRDANRIQRLLGRELINLGFTRDGRFRQDPASSSPALPDLAPANRLKDLADDDEMTYVIDIHLRRGQNRLIWTCRRCKRHVDAFLGESVSALAM